MSVSWNSTDDSRDKWMFWGFSRRLSPLPLSVSLCVLSFSLSIFVHLFVPHSQCLLSRLTSIFPFLPRVPLCPCPPPVLLACILISLHSSQDHPAQCDLSAERAQHLLPSQRGRLRHVPQVEGQQGQGPRIRGDHQVNGRTDTSSPTKTWTKIWRTTMQSLNLDSSCNIFPQETSVGHQGGSRARRREGAHHAGRILRPHTCPGPRRRLRPLLRLLLRRRRRGRRGRRLLLRWGWLRQRGVMTCFSTAPSI